MATIRTRQRRDGSLAYLSEVRIMRNCEINRGAPHVVLARHIRFDPWPRVQIQ